MTEEQFQKLIEKLEEIRCAIAEKEKGAPDSGQYL